MEAENSLIPSRLHDLLGRAREIERTVVAENAEREDREASWPAPAMAALAEAGLTGLNAPTAAGGHGEGLLGLTAITEAIGRESGSTALCYAMHCVGTAVIAAKATEYQTQNYLEPIARGEHITTLALSEPGTGMHFYIPQTQLTAQGDEYVLHGTKSFITNGGHCDSYVVSAASAEQPSSDGAFSCVVMDADTPRLEWLDEWRGLGMRANSSRTLKLDGVPVPRCNLLGA